MMDIMSLPTAIGPQQKSRHLIIHIGDTPEGGNLLALVQVFGQPATHSISFPQSGQMRDAVNAPHLPQLRN